MKNINNFINEKLALNKQSKAADESFIDSVKALLKKYNVKYEIKKHKIEDTLYIISNIDYDFIDAKVHVCWKNGGTLKDLPAYTITSTHQFDKEPLYIEIESWQSSVVWDSKIDENKEAIESLTKILYNDLFDAGLKEATDGKNPQHSYWRFAVRSKKDERNALKYLEKYMKELTKIK